MNLIDTNYSILSALIRLKQVTATKTKANMKRATKFIGRIPNNNNNQMSKCVEGKSVE